MIFLKDEYADTCIMTAQGMAGHPYSRPQNGGNPKPRARIVSRFLLVALDRQFVPL